MRLLTSTRRALRTAGAAGVLVSLFLLGGCQEDNELGIDLLPDSVPAGAIYRQHDFRPADLTTIAKTDSLLTSNRNSMLVGQLRDAVVGTTTASCYAQLSPLSSNLEAQLPATAQIKSVLLYMPYSSFNGTADGRLSIEVLELTQGIDPDQAYYGDSPALADNGIVLADTSFAIRYTYTEDTIRVLKNPVRTGDLALDTLTILKYPDTARVQQPLIFRINKDSDLVRRLRNTLGTSQAGSLEGLLGVVKGLVFRPKAGTSGAIAGFNATSTSMRMVMYYRTLTTASDTTVKSFSFALGLGDLRRYYTRLRTDFSTGRLTSLPAGSVPAGSPNFETYVQGGVELGTRLQLRQTFLDSLRALKGKIVINRAELIIPTKPFASAVFGQPGTLYAYQADEQGRILRSDGRPRTVESAGANPKSTDAPQAFTYDASTQTYRGLLTAWLDAYVNERLPDQKVRQLVLLPTVQSTQTLGMSRVVLDAAPGRIKLKVYYSTLN